MKEDIKILEELIKYWKDLIKTTKISNPIYHWIRDDKIEQKAKALENLITEYKELEDKNKEFTEVIEEWVNGERISYNCIPKSKVKEKIEELKKEHEKYNGCNGLEISRNGLINAQIQKLQELLQREESNV